MNGIAQLMLLVSATLLPVAATARPLTCPVNTPPDWGAHQGKLEAIRILSAPPKYQIDDDALPIMAPFSQTTRNGALYEQWNINSDAPAFVYQVDCLYEGTSRYIRLDASTVSRCVSKSVKRKEAYTLISFRCE